MSFVPVRSDLLLVHHRSAPPERAFIINDRATHRYWRVGPIQYEMARWFSQRELSWDAACAKLRAQFSEPVSDDEIKSSYDKFVDLGLLELRPEAVSQLSLATYRRALKLSGVRAARGRVAEFLRAVAAGQTSCRDLATLALDIAKSSPNDAAAQGIVAAFHRALNLQRVIDDNARLPPLVRWMRIQVPMFDPNAQLDRWLPRIGWLFSTPTFLLTVAIALLGFYSYLEHARVAHQRLGYVSANLGLLFFCTVLMLVVHEYAHAFVCKRYGGEVREIGVIVFLFFIPAAYCDVSDAHLFQSRRQKLWVTFAGTYSTFVLASLGALLFANTVPTALINHVGLVLMASGYATVLTNLNPLLPLDGYFFLGDWLGVDNLRDRAPDYCKAWLSAFFTGRPRPVEDKRHARIYFAYFIIGTLYQLFYLALGVGFGWLILVRGGTRFGLLLYVALVYLFYVRTYVVRLSELWREAQHKRLFAYVTLAAAFVGLLVFVPFSTTVAVPVQVRETSRQTVIAPESGLIEALPAAGTRVVAGSTLFRIRAAEKDLTVRAPVDGVFHPSREWMNRAPIDAGAEVGAIVTGHMLEGLVGQKNIDAIRQPAMMEARILGQALPVDGIKVVARPEGGRAQTLVQVGILAQARDSLTLEDGLAARLVVQSAKTTSLWRRLWGDQWDRIILDVWRVL